ncbi:MAG TPA: hypothetical protein H9759_03255 [Candidatus Dietzia intestinipullorum]|nr:hypothetical protein [Candidatus Dietzia intestinipullorum]
MTTTLLKHEWLRTRGTLGMLFGILALVVILGALLAATGWPLLSELGVLLAMLGLFVLVPATQLLLTADYWRSGYGRTGYFTHSIPARGATIFRAKLAWAIIASFAALVLTVVLGLAAWWAVSLQGQINTPSLTELGGFWSTIREVAPVWMIVVGAVLMVASFLIWPIYYYFAVSVGHESRFAGMGPAGPVVVFVVLYICIQVASFIGMVVIPFGVGMDGDTVGVVSFHVLGEMAAGATDGEVMPLGFLVPMGLLLAFCAWRTARSWNRKVALA